MFDTLVNRIFELTELQPQKLAAAFKKEQLTFQGLSDKIVNIGNVLRSKGIGHGDCVVFTAISKPEMIAVYLGIQYCGAIAVFADKNGTPENIAAVYKSAGGRLLLTDKPMKEQADSCSIYSLKKIYQDIPETKTVEYRMPKEDDIAELLFTTGTTGEPKGVKLSYKAVYHIFTNTIQGIGMNHDDRVLMPLPLNHSFALRVLRATLYLGATVILQNGFTFAKEIENNITAFECTALVSVPASIETIRIQMQDRFVEILSRLRYIEVGAGSLSIAQRKYLTENLPDTVIYNTWGSSESGGALFLNVSEAASDAVKIEATGKPLPCVDVRTLDADGRVFASDRAHPGRMALKGDMLMSGYWDNETLTKDTLQNGWLLTSDMVYTDADGYVYMLGRADDIINVGGEKVSPLEIENIACQCEGVRECACIGVEDSDKILGQVPVLFVVPGNHYSENELHKFLSARMERYKLPHQYFVLDELPRNRMQKIDRKGLQNIWENRDGKPSLINPVIQALLSRRSIRKFTEQKIPQPVMDMIVKTGYYAPSGHNMQSWKFTVLEREDNITRLKQAAKTAAERKKVYFYGFENPTAVILLSNDFRNPNGCQDSSCAAENIMLAAHSYGIGSTWINVLKELRNEEPVKTLLDEFGIPKNHIVWSTIVLGYPLAEGAMLAKKKDVMSYIDRH